MQEPTDNSTFHSNIPVAADITLGVIYSLFGVCSLCGNSMLLYVSHKRRHQLKPAEFFIVNLAVSDLGMTLSLYPLAVTSSFQHRWLYGRTVCVVYAFCGVLFGICSLSTLTILSTVCCLKVCYPLYGNRLGVDRCRALTLCAWAYALLFATSPLFHWGRYGPEPYGTACCIDWSASNRDPVARSYTTALFICCYALPCTIIILSYTHILLTVRESRRALERHATLQMRMGNVQTVIVKLSVAVCMGFFAAWSPYAFVSIWAAFGDMEHIPPLAFAVPAVFSKSSTIYNPLTYLLLKPNFRQLLCRRSYPGPGPAPSPNLSLALRSLRPVGPSTSGSGGALLGAGRCPCKKCDDPFEQFRRYPRRCPASVNTVQLSVSLQESLEAEGKKQRLSSGTERGPQKRSADEGEIRSKVRVLVRGRKRSSEIDNLEITLETVPVNSKESKSCKHL